MGKRLTDIAGYSSGCFYYEPCPLCYGCRNFNKYCISRCEDRCGRDLKLNVCNTKLHTVKNLELMITRPRLDLDGEKHIWN